MIHKSVLLEGGSSKFKIKTQMAVVDGTLGAGGHSKEILKRILPGGKLISIDWDPQAVESFKERLKRGISIAKRELIRTVCSVPANIKNTNDDQIPSQLEKLGNRGGEMALDKADNYANIKEVIEKLGMERVDAVLVDLGFSSDQIENAQRGFSFLQNGLRICAIRRKRRQKPLRTL